MTGLLSAIVTYFSAAGSGPLSSRITGGIFDRETSRGATMPYCVYDVISAGSTAKYGGYTISEPQIQFTVFAVGSAAALDLLDNASTGLITKFDSNPITVGGNAVYGRRLHDAVPVAQPELDQSGNLVSGWSVTYAFGVPG